MQPPATLRLNLSNSRGLAVALILAHVGIVTVVWILPLKWWLALGLSMTAAASLAINLITHALRVAPWAAVALELRDDGLATVHRCTGTFVQGPLLGSTFVGRWLVVLNVQPAGRRHCLALVVPRDCASFDEFRRLRVWLRWRLTEGSTGQ
jgi:toxin CptA